MSGRILTVLMFVSMCHFSVAQQRIYYKTVGSDSLYLDVYYPENQGAEPLPALVYFFGGGWNKRNLDQFEPHAEYFSKRGLINIIVKYRTYNFEGTSPAAALRDAKSSIRFLRAHADSLKINADKIIAAGGSAGGHLAAACAVVDGFNEPTDDLSFSTIPNALVLFNPVIDNGPGGYGYDRVSDYYKDFSPLHNLKSDTPPTLFMVGTNDRLIPVETAEYYQKVMEKMGLRCDLKLYEGKGHGFFNYRHFDMYKQTVTDTDEFLQSLGYLNKDPLIKID